MIFSLTSSAQNCVVFECSECNYNVEPVNFLNPFTLLLLLIFKLLHTIQLQYTT